MSGRSFIDITGKKFKEYTVLRFDKIRNRNAHFLCLCSCGNERIVSGRLLRSGKTGRCNDCKAIRNKTTNLIHGHCPERIIPGKKRTCAKTPTYTIWDNMIQRCTNPHRDSYEHYFEQGITICQQWMDSFESFLNDMGERPENLTLGRIDTKKGFYRENCRWVKSNR